MPEGYTHVRTARRAAAALHYKIQCPEAFAAGANGPDSFFCFEVWKRPAKRRRDLPALGNRMHEEKTGAFLYSLCSHVPRLKSQNHRARQNLTLKKQGCPYKIKQLKISGWTTFRVFLCLFAGQTPVKPRGHPIVGACGLHKPAIPLFAQILGKRGFFIKL